MAARLQRGTTPVSCVTSTGMPIQIIVTILSCQSPHDLFYTWCNMLLTGLYHSPLVSIPLLLSSNSSILLLHLLFFLPSLTCTRVRGNHHHHPKFDMQKWICILCIWYAYYVHIFSFKNYCHSVMHCCWMCFCLSVSNTRNLFYSY